ncbi:MAG: hypothetical protein OEP95_16410 [Myxococcales bacterium]|nr:hypothetical protein [Myxococcales bacterium]
MTKIFAPDGAVRSIGSGLAPLPHLRAGCRIGVLDNGKPGADILLERLAERIATRTGATFTGTRRKGSAATPCEEELLATITGDLDLVLTGTAD